MAAPFFAKRIRSHASLTLRNVYLSAQERTPTVNIIGPRRGLSSAREKSEKSAQDCQARFNLQTSGMTFLPIVQRELRVAARKASTIWFRVLAALVALIIAAGFLTLSLVFGTSNARFGPGLFSTLTWMALAATLAAGLFFTADSLSEEKREGTLGFLFLTDLRGYDVVGGKLLATSLRGSYALLALFPVIAITLLMGGVAGAQFWKSMLALVNALFCSLAAGLFISSLCRDSQRAMGGTLLLLALICAGGLVADALVASARRAGFSPMGSLASPVYVFWAASAWGKTRFWQGLLASHAVGWVCLALACVLAPRTWQQRGQRVPGGSAVWAYSWKYGHASARRAKRGKLMDPNPMMWLAARERWQTVAIWALVLLVLGSFGAMASWAPSLVWIAWAQLSSLIIALLYLWTASQACRFNVEARKTGLLELLLVTPLDGKAIVSGQWQALLRLFGLPVVLLVAVQLTGAVFAQRATFGAMAARGGVVAPAYILNFVGALAAALSMLGNMTALMWFGMWMGLTSKNASLATLKTVVFVQVLPWLVISFASMLLVGLLMFSRVALGSGPSNTLMISVPLVMSGVAALLSLAKDAAYFIWARDRLFSRFRVEAARTLGTPRRILGKM